ncbi:interleukin-18 receptor accessory protein-like isoform X2 [Vanacampus margaritifer]
MQTGYVLLFWVFPVFLERCCVKRNRLYKTGPHKVMTQQHYRVVEGEMFLMPCINNKVTWYKIGVGREENGGFNLDCGREFLIEAKHSGNYTLLAGKRFLYLQVLDKRRLACYKAEEVDVVMLLAGAGGKIPCPGFSCTISTGVTWYKGNRSVWTKHRDSCVKNGHLHLCTVYQSDTGRYFCDSRFIEQGVEWTFRRPVNVTAIPSKEARSPPRITLPDGSTAQEVELGKPHILRCLVHFPFEVNFSPQVQWYMNNMDNRILLHTESQDKKRLSFEEFMVTHTSIIQEVTYLHLNHTYTCMATNAVENSSVTVKLKRKIKEKWPSSLIGYQIASLLLVAGLGIVLRVKWLELQLIYISRFQRGKVDADSPLEPFNSEHGIGDLRPPEVLIPLVLEDLWGYRLCLLERDMLPGEAYTNDVVRAIRRSQILICVVSTEYLSNSNAVFVLESGIKVLLQSSTLKILLIRTNRTSAHLIQPDSPMPSVVQRALKVLPGLDWNLGHTERATGQFWRSLRKVLPTHRVRHVTRGKSHVHYGQYTTSTETKSWE